MNTLNIYSRRPETVKSDSSRHLRNQCSSAIAGRRLTSEMVADAIKETEIEEKVKHRHLIILGMAARLSGEIEELSKWHVMVGPRGSSGILFKKVKNIHVLTFILRRSYKPPSFPYSP